MTFEIDVFEQGSYAIELIYDNPPDNTGAVFRFFTQFDTV